MREAATTTQKPKKSSLDSRSGLLSKESFRKKLAESIGGDDFFYVHNSNKWMIAKLSDGRKMLVPALSKFKLKNGVNGVKLKLDELTGQIVWDTESQMHVMEDLKNRNYVVIPTNVDGEDEDYRRITDGFYHSRFEQVMSDGSVRPLTDEYLCWLNGLVEDGHIEDIDPSVLEKLEESTIRTILDAKDKVAIQPSLQLTIDNETKNLECIRERMQKQKSSEPLEVAPSAKPARRKLN